MSCRKEQATVDGKETIVNCRIKQAIVDGKKNYSELSDKTGSGKGCVSRLPMLIG